MAEMHPLETIMNREVHEIKNSPATTVSWDYTATLHVTTNEGVVDIKALMVNSVNLLRDYMTRFGDVVTIQVAIPLGDAVHTLLPWNHQFEVTLIKSPLVTSANYTEVTSESNRAVRFTGKLYDVKDALLEGKRMELASKTESNSADFMTVDIQLISPLLETIRVKNFGGIVRDSSAIDAIVSILMTNSPGVKGVTVEQDFKATKEQHIVIPHNTNIVNLPKLVNRLIGGIYPTGFRYYLQKEMWYIYSPYNVKRYDTSFKTLTVINVPSNRLSEIEVSFRTTPTQLIVLSTGDTEHLDTTERAAQTLGNGVRFMDSTQVVDGFGKVFNNKLIVDRPTNVVEAVNDTQQRSVNFAPESEVRITSAYNLEWSEFARRAGKIVQTHWESSESDLLYPGMPVRFMWMDKDTAKQMYGRLLAAESSTKQTNRSVKKKIFTEDTILTIFLANHSKDV